MTEQTRPEPERRVEPEVPRARARVRQALVCPYCRDEVSRRGTVACVRRGCGALYHRECWQECSAQYGGCAVYGCTSKTSKEVSAIGYALWMFRLLAAGALVWAPPIFLIVTWGAYGAFVRAFFPIEAGDDSADAELFLPTLFLGIVTLVVVMVWLFALAVAFVTKVVAIFRSRTAWQVDP